MLAKKRQKLESLANEIADMDYSKFTEGEDYASLTKRYSQQGKKAMDDTIGKVAARTGGLASSYATAAGNQAYSGYMEKLEDAARAMYDDQRQEKIDNLGIYKSLYDQEYKESRDAMADSQWQNGNETDALSNELYYDYNAYGGYEDYLRAHPNTVLTEGEFNQIRNTMGGKYIEDNRGNVEAEAKADLDRLWQDAEVLWSTGKTLTDDMREALGLTPEMEAAYAMYYALQEKTPTLDIGGEDLLTQLESGNYSPAVLNTYEQTYGESYFSKVLRDKTYTDWSESELQSIFDYLNDIGRTSEAEAIYDAWHSVYGYKEKENKEGNNPRAPMTEWKWTLKYDGGANGMGGINRDAIVVDPFGREFELNDNFIGMIALNSFGGDRAKARQWIRNNQENWGVNTKRGKAD